jgi:hypothetical protein
LLAGGKRRIDQTIILCRLFDGRSFTAECSQTTAAKLTQVAVLNQSPRQAASSAPMYESSRPVAVTHEKDSDSIDCPMCAERIKEKAKICRFCGCKVQEEKSKKVDSLKLQDDVDEVHQFDELYQKYVSNSDDAEVFDRESALEVMTLFSRLQKQHPDLSYRDLADRVRDEFGGNTKQPLYDLIKNGFKFLRSNRRFDIVEDRYVVVKKA